MGLDEPLTCPGTAVEPHRGPVPRLLGSGSAPMPDGVLALCPAVDDSGWRQILSTMLAARSSRVAVEDEGDACCKLSSAGSGSFPTLRVSPARHSPPRSPLSASPLLARRAGAVSRVVPVLGKGCGLHQAGPCRCPLGLLQCHQAVSSSGCMHPSPQGGAQVGYALPPTWKTSIRERKKKNSWLLLLVPESKECFPCRQIPPSRAQLVATTIPQER